MSNKSKFTLLGMVLYLGCLFGIVAAIELKSIFAISAFTAGGIACILRLRKSVFLATPTGADKPILCVWEHGTDTVLTTLKVYQACEQLRDELLVAGYSRQKKLRPMPMIYSYRGITRCDQGLTSEELKALMDSCSVHRVEMQIPMGSDQGYDIGFKRMWRMLHGPSSSPPKFPKAAETT